jgi:membrane protease YdiL (CAAX protease family)
VKVDGALQVPRFLILTSALSAPWWWMVREHSSGIYVTFMMWSPALAAVLSGAGLDSLGWRAPNFRWIVLGGLTTLLGIGTAHAPVFGFGLVDFATPALVSAAVAGLHFRALPSVLAVILLALFLTLAGTIRLAGPALGEELGWRGFLVPALFRRYGFVIASVASGLIWSLWHWPIMLGKIPALSLANFTVGIMGVGVAMAWFRLRSGSIWPSTVMHALHNSLLTGFIVKLSEPGSAADKWVDETGYAMGLMGLLLAAVFLLLLPRPIPPDDRAPDRFSPT